MQIKMHYYYLLSYLVGWGGTFSQIMTAKPGNGLWTACINNVASFPQDSGACSSKWSSDSPCLILVSAVTIHVMSDFISPKSSLLKDHIKSLVLGNKD